MLLCCATAAQAGLFTDDEAHAHIQKLEERVTKLESVNQQLVSKVDLQVKAVLDLQGQIEAVNAELRKLHGQNEEAAHTLQDGEKRVKDFYVDLDARLRHFELAEEAAKTAVATPVPVVVGNPADPNDPIIENRAFENAYALLKSGKHEDAANAFQEFIKKYADSVQTPNAKYWLGSARFALHDYRGALVIYEDLSNVTGYAKAPEVMFNIAGCQQELKQNTDAKKTLKQLVAKYPKSEAAAKASQLLSAAK